MIYVLEDPSKVEAIFEGWEETLIYSCLQKVMGKLYVTNPDNPESVSALTGCFLFFAGKPDRELVMNLPSGYVILTPQNAEWSELIEQCLTDARKTIRYAIRKDTVFDTAALRSLAGQLPEGYEIRRIDSELYDRCLENPVACDFVSSYENKEQFLKLGRGFVILRNGEIVSGASSYSSYRDGIEVEVDTIVPERRKHLATTACATLILDCLKDGLYPSWDAQNMNSVHLAEKLGYKFAHEYTVYELNR